MNFVANAYYSKNEIALLHLLTTADAHKSLCVNQKRHIYSNAFKFIVYGRAGDVVGTHFL